MDISIIIPVYNAQETIERCVNSLVDSLKDREDIITEILLFNDGSVDHSLEKLYQLKNKYPHLIQVFDQPNQGVAKTRNYGIQNATGHYLCFIDNDDYVNKDYIPTFYDAINHTDLDLVMGGYNRVNDHKILYKVNSTNSQWFAYMNVAPWAKIYRRQFILENNITFIDSPIGEDLLFNFQIYSKSNHLQILEYNGYNWYYNEKSISNSKQKGFKSEIHILQLLEQLTLLVDLNDYSIQYFFVRYVIWYLLFSGRQSNPKDFIKEYKRDFKWLNEHQIPISFPLISSTIKGESLKYRVIIKSFIIFHHLHLIPLFTKIYCTD